MSLLFKSLHIYVRNEIKKTKNSVKVNNIYFFDRRTPDNNRPK